MVYKRTVTNKYGVTFNISNNGIEVFTNNGRIKFNNHEEIRKELRVVFLEQVTKRKIEDYINLVTSNSSSDKSNSILLPLLL